MRRLFLVLAVSCSAPNISLACEYGYCWGAVATGENGIIGYAERLSTAPEAYERARQACGDKCDRIEVFSDSCAAIAETYDRVAFLGVGETRTDASNDATDQCREASLSCVVRVSACSKQ